jgi:hypothetical protein
VRPEASPQVRNFAQAGEVPRDDAAPAQATQVGERPQVGETPAPRTRLDVLA